MISFIWQSDAKKREDEDRRASREQMEQLDKIYTTLLFGHRMNLYLDQVADKPSHDRKGQC